MGSWVGLQGMHMSLGFWEWGCLYHCDSGKGKDLGTSAQRKAGRRKRLHLSDLSIAPALLDLSLAFRAHLYAK